MLVAVPASAVETPYMRMEAVIAGMRPKRSAIGPQIAEQPHPRRNIAALICPYQPIFAAAGSTPARRSSAPIVGASTSPKTVQLKPSIAQPPNDPQNARRCPLVKRSGSVTRVSVSLPPIRGGSCLIVIVNLRFRLALGTGVAAVTRWHR